MVLQRFDLKNTISEWRTGGTINILSVIIQSCIRNLIFERQFSMFGRLKCVLVLSLFIESNCVDPTERWKSVIDRTRDLSKTILKASLSYATEQYNDEKCFHDVVMFYEGIDQSEKWAVKSSFLSCNGDVTVLRMKQKLLSFSVRFMGQLSSGNTIWQ